jgi:hypothetical protein
MDGPAAMLIVDVPVTAVFLFVSAILKPDPWVRTLADGLWWLPALF